VKNGFFATSEIQHLTLSELQQLLTTYKRVVDGIPLRIFWKDKDLVYQGGNTLFAKDAGLIEESELNGRTDFELGWTMEQAENFRRDDLEVIQSGKAKLNIEEPQDHPDGKTHWLLTNKIPFCNDNGEVIGVLGTYTDISKRKWNEQKHEYQANFDQLTKLPNRHFFQKNIESYLKITAQPSAGLFFIDLDHFKTVNDSLGHHIGDELLKLVTERIDGVLDGNCFFARLGGDEFSLLARFHKKEEDDLPLKLTAIAEKLLKSFENPFSIEEHSIYLGASVGISIISAKTDSITDKFREADLAMYAAKESGRNAFRFIDEQVQRTAEREHLVQYHLRHAIKRNELYIVFQPQVNHAGTMIGAETLLRWHNEILGQVSPLEFITIAEKTGMIHGIGDWVLTQAFQFTASYLKSHHNPDFSSLAINVSVRQFQNENFIPRLQELLNRYQLPADVIELEITEGLMLEYSSESIEKLNTLRTMGFKIAIDDFGTGYSSLSYLSLLPLTKIKIDQSFTRQMLGDERQAALVKTIIGLSHSIGVDVIAEGVEKSEEIDFLLKHNCSKYQGYYYSKPVDEDQLKALNSFTHHRIKA
jgi:diguanylate cyclase (GGDEF)-like protein/PAS domain S-box-containing protein